MKDSGNRKSPRVEAEHFVSFHLFDDQGNVTLEGMALSLDLSREGILIEHRDEIPVGAKVKIMVAVGDDVVPVMGTVKHSEEVEERKFHMGIHFEDMTEEKLQRIAEYHPEILQGGA